ncbi:MAG TPA: hypothetical protein VGI58_03940 [Streptosporangiaceae bacterium]
MAAGSTYSAYVRGTEYAFPRGGRWLFYVWFLAVFVALAFVGGFSPAFLAVVFVVLALGATYFARIFDRSPRPAFSASAAGLTFGRAGGSGTSCQLTWAEISELRIKPLRGAVLLEIVTAPGVQVRQHGPAWQLAQLVLATLPLGLQRSIPAVVTPARNPDRYRIPLLGVTEKDLRSGLARMARKTPIVIGS